MAVGAAIAVVLAVATVVATRPPDLDRTAAPASTVSFPAGGAVSFPAGGAGSRPAGDAVTYQVPDPGPQPGAVLGLTGGRDYTVVLPTATWRAIAAALGPVETYSNGDRSTHAPIADAVRPGAPATGEVPVTMSGLHWGLVVQDLASPSAVGGVPASRDLAGVVAAAVGHPVDAPR